MTPAKNRGRFLLPAGGIQVKKRGGGGEEERKIKHPSA